MMNCGGQHAHHPACGLVGLQGRRAHLFDVRDLGVGGRPGDVDVARVHGFDVACSVHVRGVRGNRLK